MSKKNNLPYFKRRANKEEIRQAKFLKRKINPFLRKNLPEHYLVNRKDGLAVDFLKKKSKYYKYFLRLDIEKFFPSIDHQILVKKLPQIIKHTTQKEVSRRNKEFIKNGLPEFLERSPLGDKGLPLGNYLGYILAGTYLLPLDIKLHKNKHPFLRFCDDYIILGKSNKNLERLLSNIILPALNDLKLTCHPKKIQTGRLHRDPVTFMGYNYYGGYFRIDQEKKESFKKRIDKFSYLTQEKEVEAVIKKINNQINGFGNYYKHCQVKTEFEDLDRHIRNRVRRYAIKHKKISPQTANTLIKNESMEKIGLKSLSFNYEKYKNRKSKKKKTKMVKSEQSTGKAEKYYDHLKSLENSQNIEIRVIRKLLQELTSLEKENKKNIKKMEKKLEVILSHLKKEF